MARTTHRNLTLASWDLHTQSGAVQPVSQRIEARGRGRFGSSCGAVKSEKRDKKHARPRECVTEGPIYGPNVADRRRTVEAVRAVGAIEDGAHWVRGALGVDSPSSER